MVPVRHSSERAKAGSSVEEIYYDLVVADIQAAADLLAPIYTASRATDGYISVEVQPKHSADSRATVAEAMRNAAAMSEYKRDQAARTSAVKASPSALPSAQTRASPTAA